MVVGMATYMATLVEKLEHIAELTVPNGMTEEEARTLLMMQLAVHHSPGTIEIKELKEVITQ